MPKNRKTLYLDDIKTTKPTTFYLFINGNESLYKAPLDPEARMNEGYGQNRTVNVAQYENVYYTNLETEEKIFESFWTRGILVKVDKIDWILTDETKKIGDYLCYKATALIQTEQLLGNNFIDSIEAWYTKEIPVSFGIKEFHGLPGLTLELITNYESGKLCYIVTDIQLKPEEEIEIEKPKGKRIMSFKQYIQHIKELNARR